MKLFTSIGPNPRSVNMFLKEKSIDLPRAELDLLAGDNRRPPCTDKNSAGQLPALALELDDGRVLAETAVICEYLEERNPRPPLIGNTAEERAEARLWNAGSS